jgi:RNA polymerase sigma-70 factor (ECF subfamily)
MNAVSTLRADGEVAVNSQERNAALVDGARRRDPEAFEELVTIYGPRIFRLAQRITRNREDAEEVSQDSFARAFLHLDAFRGDCRFYTWLVRIAINESLMKLRTRRRRDLQFDRATNSDDIPLSAEVADNTPTPEQRSSQEELQHILDSAMSELPMTVREVLHLREVEEHSTEETARLLGLSISAVKSRARRGRLLLRQTLTQYFRRSEITSSQIGIQSRGKLSLFGF